MDRNAIVHALAAMTDDEFTAAVTDARGVDTAPLTPQEKAVAALRGHRGLDRKTPATREAAADALKRYASGGGD